MPRLLRLTVGVLVVIASSAWSVRASAGACDPDGRQTSGAVYRICVPDNWNGDLVLFAHGYVAFNEPVAIPESQLVLPDGTSVPDLVNRLGFAFATTSYSVSGMAVVQGVEDLVDLAAIFNATHGPARRIYVVGPSEGGLVTTLAVERHPDVFAGGLAACGPIGDFNLQIGFDGDFRVVFDHFFPGVIPGDPRDVPAETIATFDAVIAPRIRQAIADDPDATRQLLAVTRASIDPADPATTEETILGLAWYVVFATNDATEKLGGHPYGNRFRRYVGSDDDDSLNQGVQRMSSEPAALAEIRRQYQTTGRLERPLVTLHTSGDPIIPYWHSQLYSLKTLLTGNILKRHLNVKINRYGHCNFKAPEVLASFALLLFMVERQDVSVLERALPDAASRSTFRALVTQHLAGR